MMYSFILISYLSMSLVVAYHSDNGSEILPLHLRLLLRNLDDQYQLIPRKIHLRRRTLGDGSPPSSPSSCGSSSGPENPQTSCPQSSSVNERGRQIFAKASIKGPGEIAIRFPDGAYGRRGVNSKSRLDVYSPHPTEPFVGAKSHQLTPPGSRWPVKATSTGNYVKGLIIPREGEGHMLLTAPDRAPQQFRVPQGKMFSAGLRSDVPGGAKAFVIATNGAVALAYGDSSSLTSNSSGGKRLAPDNQLVKQSATKKPRRSQ